MKRLTIALTLLMLITTASATELQVESPSINQTIYGGDQLQDTIELSWDGETDTVAYLSTNIKAEDTNSEGVSVSFAENPVIVPKKGAKIVDFQIKADYYIKPDNFTITFKAESELEKEIKTKTKTQTEIETIVEYRNRTETIYENVTNGRLNESEEDRNRTEQEEDQIIQDLKGSLTSEQKENSKLSDKLQSYKYAIVGLSVAVLGLIIALIVLLIKKEGFNSVIEELAGEEGQ